MRAPLTHGHDTSRTEAERKNGIGETWHAVDMRRDTLPRKIFIDNQLIKLTWRVAVAAEPFFKSAGPAWQWSQVQIRVNCFSGIIITVAVVLHATLQVVGPRQPIDHCE